MSWERGYRPNTLEALIALELCVAQQAVCAWNVHIAQGEKNGQSAPPKRIKRKRSAHRDPGTNSYQRGFMFQDLDTTLKKILGDAGAPLPLRNADVSFEPPDKSFAPTQPTINLFLYEVKENRELRDPEPIVVMSGGTFVRRMPPLRVESVYLVTTWSDKTGAAKIAEEHLLLGEAIAWLSRFPVIPNTFLQGSLATPAQPFPPPTMVAQMDANKNAGEFWSALGSTPRPAFYLSVTISIDLGLERPEGPPVVSKETVLKEKKPPGITEPVLADIFEIGGTIRNANTLAAIK